MTERQKIKCIILCILLCSIPCVAKEQNEQRVVRALKLNEKVKLDGILAEKVWQSEGYSGFIQSEPHDGKAATEKTTAWVAYNENALYIAARMYESKPEEIISRLGRRDDFTDSSWFIFYIDPYYDKRSGFQFGVNPSGAICDWAIYNDEVNDESWDGIWESKARIDDQGWTVEMRIPFDQLRFKKNKDGQYLWGVNFRRYIKRKNEVVTFSWKPMNVSGLVSHFARLEGIMNIKTRRYIEALPYLVGKSTFSPEVEGNPFETGESYSINSGLDLKIGLKSNLTLDLTVNPDFGQVEVDPAVINLSAAESYYQEKRPFFIEGAGIFNFGYGGSTMHIGANWGSPNFFYSRRIGRAPQGYVYGEGFVNYPEWATILTAAKITGKIGNDWNIGFLNAITEREYAEIDNGGIRSHSEVEPFSNYSVLRVQKEFNKGRQGLGFIATSVLRDLRTEDLANILNKKAFGFAVDGWSFLDQGKKWVITGWLGGTTVSGSTEKIWNLQHSYPHYFQRPDADHVRLDPGATTMNGWAGRFMFNKEKGNFLVNGAVGMISPGFDSTDMGFQNNSDIINGHIMFGYRKFKPGKLFRYWQVLLFTQRNYDFGWNKIGEQRLIFITNITFLNYWEAYFQMSYNPEFWDKDLTRGGPLTLSLPFTWYDWSVSSDRRKALVLSLGGYYRRSDSGSYRYDGGINLEWKPSSNFNITVSPTYDTNHNVSQWVTNIEDELKTETYGTRYVFGEIDQKTLSCSVRLNWIFSPKISLQAYIQPFIAVGSYKNFKELARPRTFDFNRYGEDNSTISYDGESYTVDPDGPGNAPVFNFNNPDFNYKSLRGTVVFRWEYRPGSTFYAVWTQNRADYANPGDFRFGRDLSTLISAPGDNIFMIKFTHRFKI